jgi:hypothetical protein
MDLVGLFDSWLFGRKTSEFATFWHGPLDPITYTCLASFPYHGVGLTLYSYDLNIRVPAGVKVADARRIIPDQRLISRYIVNGITSLSKFSNLFRYTMLRETGGCWVDSDIICLRKPDFAASPIIIGYQFNSQGPWALNSAVLKLPKRHPMLKEMVARVAAAIDIDTKWGVIGPLLVTEMATKHDVMQYARLPSEFYPISFNKFWRVLLPGHKPGVENTTKDSTFLHLWHEFYRRSGYDKSIAPPEGSFLHDQCAKLGTLGEFRGSYERLELRRLLREYIDD